MAKLSLKRRRRSKKKGKGRSGGGKAKAPSSWAKYSKDMKGKLDKPSGKRGTDRPGASPTTPSKANTPSKPKAPIKKDPIKKPPIKKPLKPGNFVIDSAVAKPNITQAVPVKGKP
tara:strand:+ start:552 stop:896 length:345 start_codon:yes stop_codon:yes gene_type:complete